MVEVVGVVVMRYHGGGDFFVGGGSGVFWRW